VLGLGLKWAFLDNDEEAFATGAVVIQSPSQPNLASQISAFELELVLRSWIEIRESRGRFADLGTSLRIYEQ
jgi:hypothetical protein